MSGDQDIPIAINPRLLGAIAEAALADDGHRTLNMLKFDRHEIVACNGHVMVRYRFERPMHEEFPTFGISRVHAEAIAAKTERAIEVHIRPESPMRAVASVPTTSTLSGMRIGVPRLNADDYPPVDAVMPKQAEGPPPLGLGFDPRYLDLMYRIMKYAGVPYVVRVAAWGGLRDATVFEAGPKISHPMHGTHAALRFVIMPVAPMDLEAFGEALR